MAIVTIDELHAQLALAEPFELHQDDPLLQRKLDAAQGHLERILGFRIEDRFGGAGQPAVPPSLREAVCQLAAWWYEQREAAVVETAREIPFGVSELVREFRDWSF